MSRFQSGIAPHYKLKSFWWVVTFLQIYRKDRRLVKRPWINLEVPKAVWHMDVNRSWCAVAALAAQLMCGENASMLLPERRAPDCFFGVHTVLSLSSWFPSLHRHYSLFFHTLVSLSLSLCIGPHLESEPIAPFLSQPFVASSESV